MNDWIGLGVIILIVVGGFYALMRANEPRPPLTEEEFERRAAESRGMLGASINALDKIINPAAERAEPAGFRQALRRRPGVRDGDDRLRRRGKRPAVKACVTKPPPLQESFRSLCTLPFLLLLFLNGEIALNIFVTAAVYRSGGAGGFVHRCLLEARACG